MAKKKPARKPPQRWKRPDAQLGHDAVVALDILLELRPHEALIGKLLIDALHRRKVLIDQSTLTTRIIPALAPWGVTNQHRVGYFVWPSLRDQVKRATSPANARQTSDPDTAIMDPSK